jgi:predicted NACHT family NTPase
VRSHDWIDRRSLALHDAVAARLEAQPELLDVARRNVARWLSRGTQGALLEWQALLERLSVSDVVALLRSESETAVRLRQSSPFAGVLTPDERRAILRRHDPRCA